MAQLYFDDPDGEGPTRETSHPAFVRACEDELFYDCTDELGPFGNDDGADALYELQDWYRTGPRGRNLRPFIDRLLDKQDSPIPDLSATDRDLVFEWLDDDDLADAVPIVNNVLIAVAFGQAKITGQLDGTVAKFARAALARDALVLDHYLRRNPTWPSAPAVRAAIELKRVALDKLEGSASD